MHVTKTNPFIIIPGHRRVAFDSTLPSIGSHKPRNLKPYITKIENQDHQPPIDILILHIFAKPAASGSWQWDKRWWRLCKQVVVVAAVVLVVVVVEIVVVVLALVVVAVALVVVVVVVVVVL